VRTFCNDLARLIPKVTRINRGKLSLDGVAEKALECTAEKVVIVDSWQGGPGKIQFFKIGPDGLTSVPPTLFVSGVRLRREFGDAKPGRVGSLALTAPSSNLTQVLEIAEAFSNFFNIPFLSMEEAVSCCKTAMNFSSDSNGLVHFTFLILPQNVEIGPRVTISRAVWEKAK